MVFISCIMRDDDVHYYQQHYILQITARLMTKRNLQSSLSVSQILQNSMSMTCIYLYLHQITNLHLLEFYVDNRIGLIVNYPYC